MINFKTFHVEQSNVSRETNFINRFTFHVEQKKTIKMKKIFNSEIFSYWPAVLFAAIIIVVKLYPIQVAEFLYTPLF